MTERLGLLGGTFDPPHYGHLIAGQEAAWQLDLGRVLFLPARRNPLKQDDMVSPAEIRCQMVELAISDNARLALSRADLDRPGLNTPPWLNRQWGVACATDIAGQLTVDMYLQALIECGYAYRTGQVTSNLSQ